MNYALLVRIHHGQASADGAQLHGATLGPGLSGQGANVEIVATSMFMQIVYDAHLRPRTLLTNDLLTCPLCIAHPGWVWPGGPCKSNSWGACYH